MKRADEKSLEHSFKNQQSVLVKEKIKEILEDGQKKTFITLKSRQENDSSRDMIENRISVIRTVSSLLDQQKHFQFNDEHSVIHV